MLVEGREERETKSRFSRGILVRRILFPQEGKRGVIVREDVFSAISEHPSALSLSRLHGQMLLYKRRRDGGL